jgi:hypothetical protein
LRPRHNETPRDRRHAQNEATIFAKQIGRLVYVRLADAFLDDDRLFETKLATETKTRIYIAFYHVDRLFDRLLNKESPFFAMIAFLN